MGKDEAKDRSGGRGRRGFRATDTLVVLLFAGTLFFVAQLSGRIDTLETQVSDLSQGTETELSRLESELRASTISGRVVEALRPSVYLLMISDSDGNKSPIATAWVVGEGVLATNAHVAEVFDEDAPYTLSILSSTTQTTHKVINAKMHYGYKAFQKAIDEYQPWTVAAGGRIDVMSPLPGFDVGLLYVDQPEKLGPPLPLASQETLEGLNPGDPIGMLGFPLSGTASSHFQTMAPTPRPQIGSITALSFFIPQTSDAYDSKSSYAVVHNIPATQGNSGSPIINGAGEVVAILSSSGGDIRSGNFKLDEFKAEVIAQRVDLLVSLLDGNDKTDIETKHTEEWNVGFKNFVQTPEIAARVILPPLLKLEYDDIDYKSRVIAKRFTKPVKTYALKSHYTSEVATKLRNTDATEEQVKEVLEDYDLTLEWSGYFIELDLTPSRLKNNLIYAIDYQPKKSPCKLVMLQDTRDEGWAYVGDQSAKALPQLKLAPDRAEETVHFVVFRPVNPKDLSQGCGRENDRVDVGVLSWRDQSQVSQTLVQRGFGRALQAVNASWNFLGGVVHQVVEIVKQILNALSVYL